MVKALTVGISVMAGILIGRIQIIEDHEANAAVAIAERASARAAAANRDAIRTRALLDRTERQVIAMWRRLDPMLADFTHADSPIDRDAARRRIEALRWQMESLDVTLVASQHAGDDLRTALRHAYVKDNVGR